MNTINMKFEISHKKMFNIQMIKMENDICEEQRTPARWREMHTSSIIQADHKTAASASNKVSITARNPTEILKGLAQTKASL